jgi:glutathione S-transferase
MAGDYTLYSRPGSGGFVVEAAMTMAGLPFEKIDVPRSRDDPINREFRSKVNPLGQVPALILPDGGTMTESAAICLYLDELCPQAGLGPAPGSTGRREFLRWMAFLSSALYPTLLRFYYPHRGTTDPDGLEAVRAAATIESDRYFLVLESALAGRQWLVGEAFSIADVYLAMLACWHPVGERPREEWHNIVGLCGRVADHPVMAELNKTHRLW